MRRASETFKRVPKVLRIISQSQNERIIQWKKKKKKRLGTSQNLVKGINLQIQEPQ